LPQSEKCGNERVNYIRNIINYIRLITSASYAALQCDFPASLANSIMQ